MPMQPYSLLGVKSNGLLFYMKGFPDRQSKALYRLKRRLQHFKTEFQYFFTLTCSNHKITSVPVQKWQHYTGFYWSGVSDTEWDTQEFKRTYYDIKEDITGYIRKFFNNLQTWCKRNLGTTCTYCWKLEKGEKGGRLHIHCLLRINTDIGKVRYPLWFIKRLYHYWNCGVINFESLRGYNWYDKVTNYLKKYFFKKGEDTEFNRRRYGTSRDLPGYKPNTNVFYIHEQLILEQLQRYKVYNVRLDKNFFKRFIKLWKVKFYGYTNKKLDDGRVIVVADIEFVHFFFQSNLKIS